MTTYGVTARVWSTAARERKLTHTYLLIYKINTCRE